LTEQKFDKIEGETDFVPLPVYPKQKN